MRTMLPHEELGDIMLKFFHIGKGFSFNITVTLSFFSCFSKRSALHNYHWTTQQFDQDIGISIITTISRLINNIS